MEKTVVIIGAGMTGVMAARTLREKGIEDVLIVEKSRSIGGRMATRRIANGKVDHGAQFFTARTNLFQSFVDKWEQTGLVSSWFGTPHTRYKSNNGMNSLVKHLAEPLAVSLNTKVTRVENIENDHFLLTTESGDQITSKGVIVTAPVPQAVKLIEKVEINPSVRTQLKGITYSPCFVLMTNLQEKSTISDPGIVSTSLPDGIERIVDHQKKGISDTVTISLYSTGAWAKAHADHSDENVTHLLLEKAKAILKNNQISNVQLKRWTYSEAVESIDQLYIDTLQQQPLFVAGDAFLHPEDQAKRTRIESAFLSGIATGKKMAMRMKR